jgi:hypothetical protein
VEERTKRWTYKQNQACSFTYWRPFIDSHILYPCTYSYILNFIVFLSKFFLPSFLIFTSVAQPPQ